MTITMSGFKMVILFAVIGIVMMQALAEGVVVFSMIIIPAVKGRIEL